MANHAPVHASVRLSIHPFIHPFHPFHYSFILYNSILTQANFCCHCLIAQDHRAHLHKNTGLDSREINGHKPLSRPCRTSRDSCGAHRSCPAEIPVIFDSTVLAAFCIQTIQILDGRRFNWRAFSFLHDAMPVPLSSHGLHHSIPRYLAILPPRHSHQGPLRFRRKTRQSEKQVGIFQGHRRGGLQGQRNQCRPHCGVGAKCRWGSTCEARHTVCSPAASVTTSSELCWPPLTSMRCCLGSPGRKIRACCNPHERITSFSSRTAGSHRLTRLFAWKKHHRLCRRRLRCARFPSFTHFLDFISLSIHSVTRAFFHSLIHSFTRFMDS